MRQLPSDLSTKINQSLQTIGNNANPHMSIIVARARSSVRDSSYFMIEKIREKEGITDIAVSARRLIPYGSPDRIYGIHIENGIAKTSIREYPDKLKEHWKYQFDVEPAKAVSICFDGRWLLNRYKRYGLKTDETPWIFWIGNDDKLYARIWDTGEIITLAENVVKIDTMRGWIPAQAGHTDDQGIIVGYIKTDGKVYYRNYCMQSTGTILWELEREVTQFGVDNLGIRLFKSNDFRIGFIAEKTTGNMMALTNRNWAGMSIPAEKLTASVNCKIEFIPIEASDTLIREKLTADVMANIELLYALQDNQFITAYNVADENNNFGFIIITELEHNLTNIDVLDFVIIDSINVNYAVRKVEKVSDKIYKFTLVDFNNARDEVKLKFLGSGNTKGEAGQEVDTFEITFIPEGLVPTEIPLPEVEVIWNE